jgi:glutamine synthetase
MTLIARREILPAIEKFADDLSNTAMHKNELVPGLECLYEKQAVSKLSGLTDRIFGAVVALEKAVNEEGDCSCNSGKAEIVRDRVLPAMRELRNACDEAESIVGSNCWPFPTYSELLYSVD